MRTLGWDRPDVILVTGDTYIDSSYSGAAVIGRVLVEAGFRVGIIAQPFLEDNRDIARLGEPALFWGVTGGAVDSMIANTTSSGKRRKRDDMTPGGINDHRPDRSVIVYANLIRRYFKKGAPIVLGGVEASLRRISHYDAWSDMVRRSILFDAKADYLVYGMGESTVVRLAKAIALGEDFRQIRGLCYISNSTPELSSAFAGPDLMLPPHDIVRKDPEQLIRMFRDFYASTDPVTAGRIYQRQDTRYLVQNPPSMPLSQQELDAVYELPYAGEVHPYYGSRGPVAALETIRFSLTTHRGCYGECRFCAITVHQGRQVVSRSEASLLRETAGFLKHPRFRGIIMDVGGPTANMYGIDCERKHIKGSCPGKACLFPDVCPTLPVDHGRQIRLLRSLRNLPGVRKVFVGSGIRYDLIMHDKKNGERYLDEILGHHVSGQLKIAPEHCSEQVLRLMGKPGPGELENFIRLFESIRKKRRLKVFLTYYLMAAHPGCTMVDMQALRRFAEKTMKLLPEQVQIFTPSPSTYSTLMYATGTDPFTGKNLFVERSLRNKVQQKAVLSKRREVPRRPSGKGVFRKDRSSR
jgi:uncharacterized radical SAM protein YgiQ